MDIVINKNQLLIEQQNLDVWFKRDRDVGKHLRLFCFNYIIAVSLVIAALAFIGIFIREDVSLIVDNFSLQISDSTENFDDTINFIGIIPRDALENFSIDRVKKLKLYLSKQAQNISNSKRRVVVEVKDIHFEDFDQMQNKNGFGAKFKRMKMVKPMKMSILNIQLSGKSHDGIDIAKLIQDFESENNDIPIKKVKIVLGETSLLKFWIKKIFSQSELFKRTGYLVD